MESEQYQELIGILRDIQKNQREQIERQTEALKIQAEQYDLVRQQTARNLEIQDRAERLQEKGNALMERGRKLFLVIVPIIFLLIVYLSWLLFR
jgi:small-conductance mechanosensitive channel